MAVATGIPRTRIGILGVVTIAAYGCWFYAFGVLFDPIIADTGWSEPALASAFSASILIGGVGSIAGGWLLDRFGSRTVFVVAAVVTLAAFQTAAAATDVLTFAIGGAIGGGVIAALGFYHVTQTTAVRISPGSTDRAIAVLTIWGAFASAIYMPITAFLVGPLGWRSTLRVLTFSAAVALIVGAIAMTTKTSEMPATRNVLGELKQSLKGTSARRFLLAQGLAGIGVATLLVYQVPAMTSAGLPLAAASFWAGARGFSQLFGRLPLMPIVRRFGVVGSLRLAYGATSLGTLVLAIAGNPWFAALYAALAGFGIGATSPLVGMYSSEVFGARSLGTAMGLMGMVFLVVGSIGPAAAGFIADATGSRAIPVAGAAVMTILAALVIRSSPDTRS